MHLSYTTENTSTTLQTDRWCYRSPPPHHHPPTQHSSPRHLLPSSLPLSYETQSNLQVFTSRSVNIQLLALISFLEDD